jgi:hypothetical protein
VLRDAIRLIQQIQAVSVGGNFRFGEGCREEGSKIVKIKLVASLGQHG